MKNKLQAELKDLATKILNSGKDNSLFQLKQQARDLYEKITILAFTEENLKLISSEVASEKMESVGAKSEVAPEVVKREEPQPAKPEKFIPHVIEEKDEYLPDGTQFNDAEAITEPNTEKIKDIVAHMPPETQNLDNMISNIISKNGVEKFMEPPVEKKPDFRNIGVDYDNLPSFEPVKKQDKEQRPRSLNDRLKNGINIGLNERLAFIRHLFDGKTADYNRVISQLNTFDSVTEAKKFIQMVVKPDYKNWAGKEEYEQKFLDLVENKFKQ